MPKAGCARVIAEVAVARLFTVVFCGLRDGQIRCPSCSPGRLDDWPPRGGVD